MPNNVISKIQLPNGNTYDIKDSEAKRKQTAVNDPTASGTAVEFINSISQNVEGVITPTKKTVATVTTSADGLMSATDKTKLNGIETGAQVNSITGVKGIAENSYRTGNINLTPENLGIPSSNATQSADGFMSSTDKSKLDGIEVGAEVNTITGVKGNEESTYRTGNINLTSANIGAKAIQTAVTDPVAEGTSIEFIDSISQNAQGVITPTKKNVATATTSTNGLMSASDKNKLDNLDAEDVGAIKDDYNYDYVGYPYTGNELILLHNTTTGINSVTDVASFLSSAGGSGSGSNQGALVHYTKRISLNATAGTQAQSFSDSNITENMVVLQAEIENPSAQANDWIFNTTNGMITLNGTVNAATNVTLYFGVQMSAAPSIKVNLASTSADNILKANPQPGVMGALGVPNGGTGATTPAGACASIGAVKKSGDTMTGNLIIQTSHDPAILYCRTDGALRGYTLIADDNRYIIIQKHLNDDHLDLYYFPIVNSGSDASYDVLTTKSPVTVQQGGTGATTPAEARANLELTPSALQMIATGIYVLKIGNLAVIACDGNNAIALPSKTWVTLGYLPNGYVPSGHFYGTFLNGGQAEQSGIMHITDSGTVQYFNSGTAQTTALWGSMIFPI